MPEERNVNTRVEEDYGHGVRAVVIVQAHSVEYQVTFVEDLNEPERRATWWKKTVRVTREKPANKERLDATVAMDQTAKDCVKEMMKRV